MLSSISNFVGTQYFYIPAITLVSSLIVIKVIKIAKPIIFNLSNKIYQNTFFCNVRSLFCNKCSSMHKFHEHPYTTKVTNQFIVRQSDLPPPKNDIYSPTTSPEKDKVNPIVPNSEVPVGEYF